MNYKQRLNQLKTDKIMWHITESIHDAAPEPGEVPLADERLVEAIRLAVSLALHEMEG